MGSRAGFGKPKDDVGFKKTGKVVKGDNEIRILPPMGDCAEDGIWRVFRVTHWGYSGVNKRDQSKTVMRPFRCIREKNRDSKMITQECPACVRYERLEEEAKEREAKLRASGKNKDEIETAMTSIKKELQSLRPEARWYVNAFFADGSCGDFKMNHKDHMSRVMQFRKGGNGKKSVKEEYGYDLLDIDEGVWLNINRSGDGISPPDTVDVKRTEVEVPGTRGKAYVVQPAPLTDEQCERALKECPNLKTRGGVLLTYEQIEALTKCSGNPEEVDAIFGNASDADASDAGAAVDEAAPATREEKAPPAAPPAKSEVKTTPVTPPKLSDEQIQARLKQIAEKKAAEAKAKAEAEAKARAEAEAAAAASTATDPTSAAMDLDDESFAALYGNQAGK